jgi:AAA15 family ATPase/GTPase
MKPRLSSLKIENFRMLENLEIKKLGNVNLIVGKNNSGKSTVLEALRVYAGCANPNLLEKISLSHYERQSVKAVSLDDKNIETFPVHYQHFFSGRKFPDFDSITISIGGIDGDTLNIHHSLLERYEERKEQKDGSVIVSTQNKLISKEIISKENYNLSFNLNVVQSIAVAKNNKLMYRLLEGMYSPFNQQDIMVNLDLINCKYVSSSISSLLMNKLGKMWDKVGFSSDEKYIYEALKIIHPDFEALQFVASVEDHFSQFKGYQPNSRLAMVKLFGEDKKIPLSSMGDGMLRILSLILNLISAKDGFLLIDEFENGLHYSIQPKVWALIFKLAKDFNIQVFATTHSKDCVESFSEEVLKNDELEGVLIEMGRSAAKNNLNAVIATEYSEEELADLISMNMEVR